MLPLLAPLLSTLASNGLSMLAGAIQAKGKEVIEDKLGVQIPEEPSKLTPELLQELQVRTMEHEEFLIDAQIRKAGQEIEAEKAASKQVTERWSADMKSDSWLSKNIRPMVLIYLTTVFTIFALLSMSDRFQIDGAYVTLLAELLGMVYGAYFIGRSAEKGLKIWKDKKEISNG